ncbi:unnamed protein product [Peronospora belbahrii]|uniref:Uncharacterized protein n=1 Tax=Peronospora belbahrii TaxID=622444 RepID=A0AAU9L0D2_9STRA|nr:unnamed protein product [Peronospora belbahrii]
MIRKATFELGRCIRETGQALDRLGLRVLNDNSFKEKFSRHRQVMALYDKRPKIAHDVWVAPNATIVGDVEICNDASVFYNVVIRGDLNQVQTLVTMSQLAMAVRSTRARLKTTRLLAWVPLSSTALWSSPTLSSLLAVLCPPGRRVPAGQLWAGNPANYVRDLSDDEVADITKQASEYKSIASTHSDEFLPYGTAYLDAEKIKAAGGHL